MDKVIGRECIRAVYCPGINQKNDLLVVKEKIHYEDRIEDNLRLIHDFPRDFYVTKPGYRNHEDLKEWEDISKCDKFTCTQAELPKKVAQALGVHTRDPFMKQLSKSQFLYGTDVSTTTMIKQWYKTKWPKAQSPKWTVAALDCEADPDTQELHMISFTMKQNVHLFVVKKFVAGVADPIARYHKDFEKYLGVKAKKRGCTFLPEIVATPAMAVKRAMEMAHKYKPDFVSMWNQNYDVPLMVSCLEKENFRPSDVFSDPSIPRNFKFFKYIEGKATKNLGGEERSLKPYERWHKPMFPASFFFVSSDAVYYDVRKQKGLEPNYKLDGVLQRNIGERKLDFPFADHLEGYHWHKFMQANYPIEYGIYCVYDSMGLEELDEHTKDLSQTFGIIARITDFENFKSNPKKIADSLHFYCLKKGKVIGSVPPKIETDLDHKTVSKDGWVLTLPAYMLADEGIPVFANHPELKSTLYIHCADSDVSGTYPEIQATCNVSNETKEADIISIENMTEEVRRIWGINYLGGEVNAIELAMVAFDMPAPDGWVARYRASKASQQAA